MSRIERPAAPACRIISLSFALRAMSARLAPTGRWRDGQRRGQFNCPRRAVPRVRSGFRVMVLWTGPSLTSGTRERRCLSTSFFLLPSLSQTRRVASCTRRAFVRQSRRRLSHRRHRSRHRRHHQNMANSSRPDGYTFAAKLRKVSNQVATVAISNATN